MEWGTRFEACAGRQPILNWTTRFSTQARFSTLAEAVPDPGGRPRFFGPPPESLPLVGLSLPLAGLSLALAGLGRGVDA